MVLGVIIGLIVLAVAVGVYFVVLSPHADNVSSLVSDSYEAMRSSDLNVAKDFDVNMCDTHLGDIFASFPEDSSDVLTAQSIVEEVDKFRVDITQLNPKHLPIRYPFNQKRVA